MFHIHISFVSPLRSLHIPPDQHQGRILTRKGSNYPCAAMNFPIESLDGVVGADAGPMFSRKVAIGKRFLYAVFHFLAASLSFITRSSSATLLAFSRVALLLSYA